MKLIEDYIVTPDDTNDTFLVNIVKKSSPFYEWQFRVGDIKVDEKTEKEVEEEGLPVNFTYHVLHPETIPEKYDGDDEHPEIQELIGNVILGLLIESVENQMKLKETGAHRLNEKQSADSNIPVSDSE